MGSSSAECKMSHSVRPHTPEHALGRLQVPLIRSEATELLGEA